MIVVPDCEWNDDFECICEGLLNTVPVYPMEPPLSSLGLFWPAWLLDSFYTWGGATYFRVLGFITAGSGFTLFTWLSIIGGGSTVLY